MVEVWCLGGLEMWEFVAKFLGRCFYMCQLRVRCWFFFVVQVARVMHIWFVVFRIQGVCDCESALPNEIYACRLLCVPLGYLWGRPIFVGSLVGLPKMLDCQLLISSVDHTLWQYFVLCLCSWPNFVSPFYCCCCCRHRFVVDVCCGCGCVCCTFQSLLYQLLFRLLHNRLMFRFGVFSFHCCCFWCWSFSLSQPPVGPLPVVLLLLARFCSCDGMLSLLQLGCFGTLHWWWTANIVCLYMSGVWIRNLWQLCSRLVSLSRSGVSGLGKGGILGESGCWENSDSDKEVMLW